MSLANDDRARPPEGWRRLRGRAVADRIRGAFLLGYPVRLVTGGIILAVLILQTVLLWQTREETWERAVSTAEGAVDAMADRIDRVLLAVESELIQVQAAFEAAARAHGDRFAPEEEAVRALDGLVLEPALPADLVNAVAIVSSRGRTLAEAGTVTPSPLNLSDRDYFLAQVSRGAGTFVSAPFSSRHGGGESTIALSRRLSAPGGAFGGVVFAGVRLEHLRAMLESTRFATIGSVALETRAGERITEAGPVPEGQSGATILARQRVGNFPLLVVAQMSADAVYRTWTKRALLFGSISVAVCMALAWLIASLQSGLIRSTEMQDLLIAVSLTDPLTGLPNRRAFDDRLKAEMRRTGRTRQPVTLLMIDIDQFKIVNDSHGHTAGDRLLRVIARQIQRSVGRPGDMPARFGGDEFSVLLPDTDTSGGRFIAERIRSDVARSSVALDTGERLASTVSIGVATLWPNGETDETDLIAHADAALYKAKIEGRNRVRWEEAGADTAPAAP